MSTTSTTPSVPTLARKESGHGKTSLGVPHVVRWDLTATGHLFHVPPLTHSSKEEGVPAATLSGVGPRSPYDHALWGWTILGGLTLGHRAERPPAPRRVLQVQRAAAGLGGGWTAAARPQMLGRAVSMFSGENLASESIQPHSGPRTALACGAEFTASVSPQPVALTSPTGPRRRGQAGLQRRRLELRKMFDTSSRPGGKCGHSGRRSNVQDPQRCGTGQHPCPPAAAPQQSPVLGAGIVRGQTRVTVSLWDVWPRQDTGRAVMAEGGTREPANVQVHVWPQVSVGSRLRKRAAAPHPLQTRFSTRSAGADPVVLLTDTVTPGHTLPVTQ